MDYLDPDQTIETPQPPATIVPTCLLADRADYELIRTNHLVFIDNRGHLYPKNDEQRQPCISVLILNFDIRMPLR